MFPCNPGKCQGNPMPCRRAARTIVFTFGTGGIAASCAAFVVRMPVTSWPSLAGHGEFTKMWISAIER